MTTDLETRIDELEAENIKLLSRGREMLETAAQQMLVMEDRWKVLEIQNSRLMEFIRRSNVVTPPTSKDG